ncbi:RNA 2'-phosphotransferase [[Eubacterium] cellulosolvens]
MLRQCLEHGYFRGEYCPTCNQKGRFLMNSNELNSLGRILAGILRHFPEKFKLEMDPQGWVVINSMIQAVRTKVHQFHWLRPHHILALVETDPKKRYEIRDNVIRATYGHSLDVDPDLPTEDIPDKLYYPTTREEVGLLMETGLKPSDRKKVHLSLTSEDAENAGKFRVPNPIILEIDAKGSIASGNIIKHAGTTVFTTAEVSSQFIKVLNQELMKDLINPTDGGASTLLESTVNIIREIPSEEEAEKTESTDTSNKEIADDAGTVEQAKPAKSSSKKKTKKNEKKKKAKSKESKEK